MFLVLENIVPPDALAAARDAAERAAFVDGRETAGAEARKVKANQQAKSGDPAAKIALDLVREALQADARFRSAVRPVRLSPLMLSRAAPGMSYGAHIDDAMMGKPDSRLRADVSFTVFLSDPESCEGGELVIEEVSASRAIKLPAGSAILYPSSTLHRVAPVTAGERLAAVGWAQSAVRDPARREMLYELEQAAPQIAEDGPRLTVRKTLSNLLRMWSEV